MGPTEITAVSTNNQTVWWNGASNPEPVADSCGRFISTVSLLCSKVVLNVQYLRISGKIGKKATAMSTFCSNKKEHIYVSSQFLSKTAILSVLPSSKNSIFDCTMTLK